MEEPPSSSLGDGGGGARCRMDGGRAPTTRRRGAARRPPRRRRPVAARRRHARAAGPEVGAGRSKPGLASISRCRRRSRFLLAGLTPPLAFDKLLNARDRRAEKRAHFLHVPSADNRADRLRSTDAAYDDTRPPPTETVSSTCDEATDSCSQESPRDRGGRPTTGWNVHPSNSKSRFIASRRDTRAYS